MAQKTNKNLFQRLTQLFRSGPVIRRKVKNFSEPTASSAYEMFKKNQSDIYSSTVSAYGAFDRMSRYSDFSEMEATPEIASALDIYAEETVSQDEKGHVLHVYSENRRLKELLETLFMDTLNIEFNLPMWTRNLCKYGDFFLFNDVHPNYGVVNAYPIPISEMEREEGYDPKDPMAVRFRWITRGNQVLENWQVSHFRLLGNDAFLPYGSSVLESARRIWRQLILMEDAMLVYRIVRAPERRVFYIDVGNIPPEEIPNYMEQAQTSLKRNKVSDKSNGKMDLRYNPLAVDEDYFIPVRGGETGTKIDSLAGGTNAAAIEDVQYIQKKLFAALKIPKAYLGYDEEIGAKATLAQEDIRFSRTISRIQKVVLSELNKIAMIHLYSHGYEGEDLLDFTLKLSNPSTIAQQQKLELISSRFDIAGKAPAGIVDRAWVRKNIMNLTDQEIEEIKDGLKNDKEEDAESGGGEGGGEGGMPGLNAGFEKQGEIISAGVEKPPILSIENEELPLKAEKKIRNVFGKDVEVPRDRSTAASVEMPDMFKMTGTGKWARYQDSSNRPFDEDETLSIDKNTGSSRSLVHELYNDIDSPKMTAELSSALRRLQNIRNSSKSSLISESDEIVINPRNDDE
jgi:hypothetical protein